jgi:hypothetical protein
MGPLLKRGQWARQFGKNGTREGMPPDMTGRLSTSATIGIRALIGRRIYAMTWCFFDLDP